MRIYYLYGYSNIILQKREYIFSEKTYVFLNRQLHLGHIVRCFHMYRNFKSLLIDKE